VVSTFLAKKSQIIRNCSSYDSIEAELLYLVAQYFRQYTLQRLLQNPLRLKKPRRQVHTLRTHSALGSAQGVPPGVQRCPRSVPDTTGKQHTGVTGN